MYKWRVFLLSIFGARIGSPAYIYPRAKIWAPWNLKMGNFSALANDVDCYNVDIIEIGSYTTISQYSYICTASHDFLSPVILTKSEMPLLTAPITIGDHVWVAADVFIAPGVNLASGTVVLARSTVIKNTAGWTVIAGNPALLKKDRVLNTSN